MLHNLGGLGVNGLSPAQQGYNYHGSDVGEEIACS